MYSCDLFLSSLVTHGFLKLKYFNDEKRFDLAEKACEKATGRGRGGKHMRLAKLNI